jgi:predicted ATPase
LFEATARAILGGPQPVLLIINGLQWCDRETLGWLPYLLQFDAQARLLVVGTCRLEESAPDQRASSMRRALRRDGKLTEIDLPPLDETETASLAERVAGRELGPLLSTCLYGETEGNPLFIVETVRGGLPAEVRRSPSGGLICIPRPLPPRMQDALETRLAQLSPVARELAQLAATIGREFSFAILARASDLGEDDLVRALDELWQQGIVCEQGADGYDFSHSKLQEAAYGGLSAARRRMLHHRVAKAMAEAHADDLATVSALVASHYERAGQPEQAAAHRQRATGVALPLPSGDDPPATTSP